MMSKHLFMPILLVAVGWSTELVAQFKSGTAQRATCEREEIARIRSPNSSGISISVPDMSASEAIQILEFQNDDKELFVACYNYIKKTGKYSSTCDCPLR